VNGRLNTWMALAPGAEDVSLTVVLAPLDLAVKLAAADLV